MPFVCILILEVVEIISGQEKKIFIFKTVSKKQKGNGFDYN
jgi:hypothetical protein